MSYIFSDLNGVSTGLTGLAGAVLLVAATASALFYWGFHGTAAPPMRNSRPAKAVLPPAPPIYSPVAPDEAATLWPDEHGINHVSELDSTEFSIVTSQFPHL